MRKAHERRNNCVTPLGELGNVGRGGIRTPLLSCAVRILFRWQIGFEGVARLSARVLDEIPAVNNHE